MLTYEQYRKLSDEEKNKKWKNSCQQYKNLVLKKLPDVSGYTKFFPDTYINLFLRGFVF